MTHIGKCMHSRHRATAIVERVKIEAYRGDKYAVEGTLCEDCVAEMRAHRCVVTVLRDEPAAMTEVYS